MRALREYPRVTVFKTLGAVVLVAAGIGIGTLVDGGRRDRVDALEIGMASARGSLSAERTELRRQRAAAREAEAAADHAVAELNATRRANRRLRRELAAERRTRRHAKRR